MKNNHFRIIKEEVKKILLFLPEKTYLRTMFRLMMGKKLNLSEPSTYNEKIQWLKINDKNPTYTKLVDKYLVREFVEDKIGCRYLNRVYGIYQDSREIKIDELPKQFVLKCTHDSGSAFICQDKDNFDFEFAFYELDKKLKRNYFDSTKEYPYKHIEPRIICEEFLVNKDGTEIKDYKFFCFNGKAKFLYVASERSIETKFDFYDMNFKHLDVKQGYENNNKGIDMPGTFYEMKQLAEILSEGIPHVRVDFYEVNKQIYFSELTFYHFSGFIKFEPEKWDAIFGSYLSLPQK